MSQRKCGIATILPVTDSFVSLAFVRCLLVLRIDSVASKESNTCLVRGLSQVANFRGTCFRFLICKSPNLRSWPATFRGGSYFHSGVLRRKVLRWLFGNNLNNYCNFWHQFRGISLNGRGQQCAHVTCSVS